MPSQFRIDCVKCGGPMNFHSELADRAHRYRCQSCGHDAGAYLNSKGGLVSVDNDLGLLKALGFALADAVGKSRK